MPVRWAPRQGFVQVSGRTPRKEGEEDPLSRSNTRPRGHSEPGLQCLLSATTIPPDIFELLHSPQICNSSASTPPHVSSPGALLPTMLPWLDLRSALPWLGAATLLVCAITVRVLQTVTHTHERRPKPSTDEASLAVFLGSGACMPSLSSYSNAELTCAPRAGGHTAEMMRLVAHLDWQRFRRRVWIVSSGDSLSETKALELEKQIGTGEVRCDVCPARCTLAQLFDAPSFASSASLAHGKCTSPTSRRPSPQSSRSHSASGTSRSHRTSFRAAVDDESSQTSFCSTDREAAC